jgi:hypothetical protein
LLGNAGLGALLLAVAAAAGGFLYVQISGMTSHTKS